MALTFHSHTQKLQKTQKSDPQRSPAFEDFYSIVPIFKSTTAVPCMHLYDENPTEQHSSSTRDIFVDSKKGYKCAIYFSAYQSKNYFTVS